MKKKLLCGIISGMLAIGVIGCGSSEPASYKNAAYDDEYYNDNGGNYYATQEAATADYYDDFSGEDMVAYSEGTEKLEVTENANATNRKLIRRVSLSVETKEYEALNANIMNEINECGGYIESMNKYNGSIYESSYNNQIQNRTCSLVARIPAAKLDAFIGKVGEKANITNQSESVDDVTLSYVDMSTHRDMLKEEQERLLGFLEEAETVEEIISLEDRLTEVRYQLESMESTIRTYDNQVDYSTVNIDIREVATYTPSAPAVELTAGERISKGFKESMQNIGHGFSEFFIGLVINLPYILLVLVLLAVAGLIGWGIVRFTDKTSVKRAEKREKKLQENLEKRKKIAEIKAANMTPEDVAKEQKKEEKKEEKEEKKEEARKQNIESKPEGTFVNKPSKKK